jgi:hypothetical protein
VALTPASGLNSNTKASHATACEALGTKRPEAA